MLDLLDFSIPEARILCRLGLSIVHELVGFGFVPGVMILRRLGLSVPFIHARSGFFFMSAAGMLQIIGLSFGGPAGNALVFGRPTASVVDMELVPGLRIFVSAIQPVHWRFVDERMMLLLSLLCSVFPNS